MARKTQVKSVDKSDVESVENNDDIIIVVKDMFTAEIQSCDIHLWEKDGWSKQ